MRVVRSDQNEITLVLTRDELRLVGNSLNEVCNALDVEEFSTRMGAEPDEAQALLHQLRDANDTMSKR